MKEPSEIIVAGISPPRYKKLKKNIDHYSSPPFWLDCSLPTKIWHNSLSSCPKTAGEGHPKASNPKRPGEGLVLASFSTHGKLQILQGLARIYTPNSWSEGTREGERKREKAGEFLIARRKELKKGEEKVKKRKGLGEEIQPDWRREGVTQDQLCETAKRCRDVQVQWGK